MSIKKELEGHISENSANNNANLKNKHTNVQNNKEGDLEDDDGYRESEDEDYNPGNVSDDASDNLSDGEDQNHTEKSKQLLKKKNKKQINKSNDRNENWDPDFDEKEIESARYSNIESSSGGLVKTRAQRQAEKLQEKQYNIVKNNDNSNVDIDAFFSSMKAEAQTNPASSDIQTSSSTPVPKTQSSSSSKAVTPDSITDTTKDSQNQIKIDRTYEFAGELIHESKWVDSASAEAKAYLSNLNKKDQKKHSLEAESESNSKNMTSKPTKHTHRRPIKKRKSLLDAVISGAKTAKLNTLEKSRLDWASYVDQTGIKDDLTHHNKGGFLNKQDFLARVDEKLDRDYKEARKKGSVNNNTNN